MPSAKFPQASQKASTFSKTKLCLALSLAIFSSVSFASSLQQITEAIATYNSSTNTWTIENDLPGTGAGYYAGESSTNLNVTADIGTYEGSNLGYTNLWAGYSTSSSTTDVSNNSLTITSGTISVRSIVGGYVYRTSEATTANNNSVTMEGISDTVILQNSEVRIEGAHAQNNLYASEATNNSVSLVNANVSAYDWDIKIYGGYTRNDASATSSSNTVLLDSSILHAEDTIKIYGGYALGVDDVHADNNTVLIAATQLVADGGSGLDINVYGAFVCPYTDNPTNVTANNNSITIAGDMDLGTTNFYGFGYDGSGNGNIETSGNEFHFGFINESTPIAWAPSSSYLIQTLAYFETVQFDVVQWGETITIGEFLGNGLAGNGTTTFKAPNVAFTGVDSLAEGDSYTMLQMNYIEEGDFDVEAESTFTVGTTLQGTGTLTKNEDDNSITYTVLETEETNDDDDDDSDNGITVQAQTHSVAMGMSAGFTAVNQAADTTSQAGANLALSGVSGTQYFSAVGGGASRTSTGSHVTVKSANFSVGIGHNTDLAAGTFSYGAAFEAGYGRFTNHFNAGDATPFISKKGHVNFYGLAFIGSMYYTNDWHTSVALRFGQMKSSQSRALYDASTGSTYNVRITSNYIGTELGAGKYFRLDDKQKIDLYGKYFYLRQGGDNFNAGGRYEIEASNSHRVRIGARYENQYEGASRWYAGAAFEHEFDGKTKVKASGVSVKPTKIDGSRLFLEAGLKLRPADSNFAANFALKGHAGKKYRSLSAVAEVRFIF